MGKRTWSTLLLMVTVACFVAAADDGPDTRAFEISDYYGTTFVGDPALSPVKELVAFSVTRYQLDKGESWSEIWMMRSDGSGLRQMTTGRHHDGSPVFSPDGRQLVFTSDRCEGGSQLFLIPVDGGEARQLTRFPTGVSSPVWSPDGRWIAVTSEVYPECGADPECNQTIDDSRANGPLTAHLADELLYRHWTAWRDGKWPHILLVDVATGKVTRDLTPGRWDSPTFSLGGHSGYAFSPDSKELCYVSNHDPEPSTSTNADLWLVKLDEQAGQRSARCITAANKGWDGDPVYSPDGRLIAYISQEEPGYEADLSRLAVYDREQGTVSYPISRQKLNNWVTGIAWSPDSRSIFHQIDEQGRNPVYRLELASGKRSRVVTHGAISGWQVTTAGDRLLYSHSAVGEPPELYRVAASGGGEPERLTRFNAELEAEVDIRPVEELRVPGDGDYEVQVWLVKPHDFDPGKQYPLILNVHGGPQMQWLDRYRGDWQVYPGKGYVVAFPNPTGSSGFGQEMVDAIACDWGGRVYRDLMKVTDALIELPYIDAERTGAMGWSYGGYMMMWFAGHTGRFKAIASMMGVYDLRSMYSTTEELWFVEHDLCGTPWESQQYQTWSPSAFVKGFKTPCLVITGERDYRVPYTQSLMFFTDLQRMNVPSRLVVYPEAGHWPSWYEMAFYYLAHLDWFHQWLGGEPAPWDLQLFQRNQLFESNDDE